MLIALFTSIAYLPVLLPFFYVKNDLVTQMLPMRFFVSESLQSGSMPWWNPYVNFGIPQYGDMNGAFWNPIVWLISISTGYNIWTITWELMFYIFLSGWGMYLLLKNLHIQKNIALIGSFSYLTCGYIVGHLQHSSWITGAAFLPFIVLYFIKINQHPSLKNFLYGALSIFIFLSSSHPGIIIGAIYFFLLYITAILFIKGSALKKSLHPGFLKNNIVFLGIAVLLSIGIAIGYSDVIPHITRGEIVAESEQPTTLQSCISFLFPLAVHKSDIFNTDISMRNMHIGIATLAGFFIFFRLVNRKIALATFLIFIFFLLLSSGGLVTSFAKKFIPGIAYVRLAGEFSLFTAFTMIIAGSYGWQQYLEYKNSEWAEIKLLKCLQYLFAITIVIAAISILISHHSILYYLNSFKYSGYSSSIKSVLDLCTINDLFFIQSCVSFILLYTYGKVSKDHSFLLYGTITAYLFIITWLCLPFTGLGSKSKREINSILLSAPNGIPIQPLKIADKAAFIDTANFLLAGLPNVYSKQIFMPSYKEYPIELKTNATIFNDTLRMQFIQQQAYLFLSKDTILTTETSFDSSNIHITKSGPGYIEAEVNNDQFRYFTFTQNNYSYWKAYINNKFSAHFTGFGSFLTVPIPRGKFLIRFEFYPTPVAIATYITFLLLLITVFALIILEIKSLFRK